MLGALAVIATASGNKNQSSVSANLNTASASDHLEGSISSESSTSTTTTSSSTSSKTSKSTKVSKSSKTTKRRSKASRKPPSVTNQIPTKGPTVSPFSSSPSVPTLVPSKNPTESPDQIPAKGPTVSPSSSLKPTNQPTFLPTASPTFPCNLSPEDRTSQIRKLLSSISDPDLFEDPSTPQAQALDWITNDDPIEPILCPNQFVSGCTQGGNVNPIVQRYVLAAFYFATQGTEGWKQCTAPADFDDEDAIATANEACDRVVYPYVVGNDRLGDTSTDAWLGLSNECEWGGVACWGADTPNLNLCIDQLDFEDVGLSGELITEISVLNSLRFLILEQGTISGPIPAQYGELNRLLILDMDFNNISGDIPEEIYGLDSLEVLDLNYNDITGSISSSIGDLELLIFLQIDHNSLSGAIPSEIGLLKNLRFAFLSDNDLTGVMPTEVCELRNNTSPPSLLSVLETDCAGNPPEVTCPCCSSCSKRRK